ncbi:hypothetical protein [Deinococcus peraridilitoris]|uniref:Uncharacterized protein n=1 Tax=Deinococcus peraridilitoris (strain DSM 19664 / LMG 22246 / CIP 109416 / KR-200) TaxID=937777 RepID=L0A504_DEIPD|nr:hypothetical protein [Deinococcus peraridilitoris]AFZ68252.1 hypothetical protein Deipe_2788 [Deinococcus peraridilitoris DSM 19664]
MQDSPIQVNGYWLAEFFGMTGWHINADDHPLNKFNMENFVSRLKLVNDYLQPALDDYSPAQRYAVKETLRYAINCFTAEEIEHFIGMQVPDLQRKPHEFLENIWMIMFGGEPHELDWIVDYYRKDDYNDSLDKPELKYGYDR